MAHTPITVDDFLDRFPGRFDDVDDAILDALLAETLSRVDDSWLEQDYRSAQFYYMAHLVTVEGLGTANVSVDGGVIASESFGPMSRSYVQGQASGSASEAGLAATEWGRRYQELRSRNFPGVAVA